MEAPAKEEKSILGSIRAPRLEDAGLEDCALSPNSIKQAFFKAANSLRSLVTEETTDGSADSLIGNGSVPDPPGPCGNEKGGGVPEVIGDVVGGGNEDGENGFNKLVGLDVKEGDGKKACVDGLEGLKINDEKKGGEKDEDDDKEGKEEPILVEAFI